MKHNLKLKKLNKKSSHRKSMLVNMSNSLIKYELIETTTCRAKNLRKFLEPIITISKNISINNLRFVFSKLNNIDSVLKLFKIISLRYLNRNGGYFRIFKNGFRKGDNSIISIIKFL